MYSKNDNVTALLSTKFVGREEEITKLQILLDSSEKSHHRRRVAIYGMTGMGKS